MQVPVSASSNAGSRAVASRDPDNAEVRLQRRMDGAPGQHSTVISPPVAVVNPHQRGLEPSNGKWPRGAVPPVWKQEPGKGCQRFSAFWHVRRWYASEARSGVKVLLQMRRLSSEIPRFSRAWPVSRVIWSLTWNLRCHHSRPVRSWTPGPSFKD